MSTAERLTAAPEPDVARGFGDDLPCPMCGSCDETIVLSLHDLQLKCEGCEAEFTPADVRAFIAKWEPVLAWLETAPLLPPSALAAGRE